MTEERRRQKYEKREPRISVYLNPDHGSWGLHLKRGTRVVKWDELRPQERERVINHMSLVLQLLKNDEKGSDKDLQ